MQVSHTKVNKIGNKLCCKGSNGVYIANNLCNVFSHHQAVEHDITHTKKSVNCSIFKLKPLLPSSLTPNNLTIFAMVARVKDLPWI